MESAKEKKISENKSNENESKGKKSKGKHPKERLDIILVERGHFSGRERAKAAIMAGEIFVDDHKIDKAGTQVPIEAKIEVKGAKLPYVSRGGCKLARAIEEFALDFQGKIVLDIGSSTGGFVDCALQNGAEKIYAVDVGYGQLAWKLRNNPQVVVLEKSNARYLTAEQVPEKVDWLTCDASFISLAKVLPKPLEFLSPQGQVMALIKPQFEAGRDKIGKKGVVRDKNTHIEVLQKILVDFALMKLIPLGLTHSPITGPEGNIEYLIWAAFCGQSPDIDCQKIVETSWDFHK